ncbi:Lar family restriction alleviation protein [Burkholderia gladioli]|uniref:Lar family restriction alleviation protein n=1 Tax=Burkholderia gladioli TaxID=28095 RepID=UPI003F7A2B41
MSDKLSDCPFCGSAVKYIQGYAPLDYCHFIDCEGCGMSSKVFDSKDAAIAAWNRRASPAPAIHMPPLNDAMRAVLTNENCIYGTPDELYAALVAAAPAIPACVGCEGRPAAGNDPCAVCGKSSAPAISESEDAARWIATSDRLPSSSDEVLVAVEFFGAGDWRIKVGYLGEEGGWHVFGGSWTPTHWMPLPEPPIDAARKGEKS